MTTVYRHNGDVLKVDGEVAIDQNCCCEGDCCPFPCDSLELCFFSANGTSCTCITDCCIQLDWNAVTSCWEGIGDCFACALGTTSWKLCCCENEDQELEPCYDYCLTYLDNNACNITIDPLYPYFCDCDPFVLNFYDIPVSGIGCCEGFPGSGTIDIQINCLPAAMRFSSKQVINDYIDKKILKPLPQEISNWLS